MSLNSFGAARSRAKGKMRPPQRNRPDTAIEESWQKLAHAIKEIQKHNASRLSFEEHYRYSYNMVLYKHGDKLYAGVKQLISDHLHDLAEQEIVPTFPRSGVMSMSSGAGPPSLSNGPGAQDPSTSISGIAGAQSVEMVVEGERFLKAIKFVWEDHSASMKQLTQVLRYMDKVHAPHAKVPKVYDLGLNLVRSQIIHTDSFPIQSHLLNTLLTQIQLERLGEIINRSAMRDVVEILTTLEVKGGKNVYTEDLEWVFLAKSTEFYRNESEGLLESCDAATYLRKVESRLSEEQNRCAHYLSAKTLKPLLAILDNELLSNHLSTILNMPGSGLVSMLDDDKFGDLQRLYKLFARPGVTEGIDVLKAALKRSILARGTAVNEGIAVGPSSGAASTIESTNNDLDMSAPTGVQATPFSAKAKGKGKETYPLIGQSEGAPAPNPGGMSAAAAAAAALRWVQDVLDLKDKFDRILREGFSDDKGIQTAINEAFQTFINVNAKAPEYISLFIDENLKKGLKGKSEDEVDVVLEKTIILFRFLLDKDVFERYYKAHLAKRLLNNRSVSEDAERNMVAKLKVESGYQFTQKLEGMFNDMRLSADTMKAFERHLAKLEPLGYDLSVQVLTSTFWPGESIQQTCNLPPILVRGTTAYEKFYHSRHSGRRLTWQASLGSADIKVQFRNRTHELNVSTYCAVILLMFEDLEEGEELGWEDIKKSTQIPPPDLSRALQSLSCGKYRVLTKFPKSREVSTTDRFSFNNGFTCPLAKIKIQTIVGKVESNAERAETQERVDEERRHQIEACIVRIMKDRKTMSHNDLVHEVARQLMTRFTPPPVAIKKRIESLIDREYLARDGMKSYQYLA